MLRVVRCHVPSVLDNNGGMRGRSKVSLALAFVFGCGGGDAETKIDAAVDAVPADAAPLRTVNGELKIHLVGTAGVTDLVIDLSSLPVAALVGPDFTAIPGVGATDGTFRIDGVPEGPYDLKVNARYAELTASTIDLTGSAIGRPGVIHTSASTPLVFDVSALEAWQATDELQLFSPETGGMAYAMETFATSGAPTAGATALAGFTYDLVRASDRALVDAAAGDQVTLTQLATRTAGTRTYRTVTRAFTPAPFTVTPGDSEMLSGAFTTVDTSKMLDVLWDRPAFNADVTAHAPGQDSQNWSTFAVSVIPEGTTRGFYDDAPDVVVFAPGYQTDTTAVSAAWPYGDPYPAEWTRVAWVRFFKYRFMQLPGAAPTAVFTRLFSYYDLSSLSATAPLEPLVGLVVNPQINGMAAYGNGTLAGIGTSPTISWTAPTVGTASRYYVGIYEVVASSGTTAFKQVASVDSARTEVHVPPGLLATGHTYVFMITARSSPNLDPAAHLAAYSLPEGQSQLVTMMATP
jgi:hypothetical protein